MVVAAARSFYCILVAAMLVGVGIGIAGLDPIKALYRAAVINQVISVPIMVAVMLAASDARIILSMKWKLLNWAATAAMAAATTAMF